MIDYVKASDFEAGFVKWRRGKTVSPGDLEARITSGIESAAKMIARCLVAGETPRDQARHIKRVVNNAAESALWAQYQNEVKCGPAQQMGTLIPVASSQWELIAPKRRCRHCGSTTHPPGCCAQDGHAADN